jgi:antitoxin component YwqK of YwqJK toxin-antitoxin module
MKFLLTLSFLAASVLCFAQKAKTQQVFYFKNNGQKVPTVDSADFIRAINVPDSGSTLFGIVDYYRNSKPKLMGKSSTIDPPVFEGQCVTFYSNGKRESVFSYTGGILTGTGYFFYPNGKLHATLEYDSVLTKPAEERASIVSCLDTNGTALVTNGTGRYVDYHMATGAISEEGPIKNGKPDGQWNGNYPAEKVKYTDTYSNGKFVSGYCITANGTRYTYTSRQQSPEFKGGEAAFIAYIKKKFKYPATLKNKSAPAVLTFFIDESGKVSQGRLLGNITPEINKTIIGAINASPNWKPAIQNGLPISSTWIVSTTFGTVTPVKKGK